MKGTKTTQQDEIFQYEQRSLYPDSDPIISNACAMQWMGKLSAVRLFPHKGFGLSSVLKIKILEAIICPQYVVV